MRDYLIMKFQQLSEAHLMGIPFSMPNFVFCKRLKPMNMKNTVALSLFALLFGVTVSAQDASKEVKVPSKESQIKTALYAAPDNEKEGAMIIGFQENGSTVVLRRGSNDLVCLADNPHNSGISSACYFKNLEPYMARGRELTLQGKTTNETREIRGEEIKAGKIKMPEAGMVYVYSADDDAYDMETGEIKEGDMRYVIYMPYATTESTGFSAKPAAPGMPWLMDPGTHRAHVMITPPKK